MLPLVYRRSVGGRFYGLRLVVLACRVKVSLSVEAALLLLGCGVLFLMVVWLENEDGWIIFHNAGGVLAKRKVISCVSESV